MQMWVILNVYETIKEETCFAVFRWKDINTWNLSATKEN
jgi:hypothetical protein